jgi:ArsR family transcriptional regulator, arsenate/arsenite/antimonite-responsive transcriptional repressor
MYNCLYGYKDIIQVMRMDELVQCLRALSEEVRLRIIMLLTQGELCVCDVMEILDEPQSKVSRHLSYLKNSGLITAKRVGVWMHYSLAELQDEGSRGQLDFMKERFSHLPRFKDDLDKAEALKERKRCEGPRPLRRKDRLAARPATKK